MPQSSEPTTPRRDFLGQVAASALVLAGTACAGASAPQTTAPAPATPPRPQAPTHWDDSWFGRLTGKHKAVFDSPEVDDGAALEHAALFLSGMRDALGAANGDAQAVVIIRHAGVIMAFNDAIWTKYNLGKERKVKDYETGKWATHNLFAAPPPRGPNDPPRQSGADQPQPDLEWLAQHGHILLACDIATRGIASIVAKKANADSRATYEEFKANLLPGVILQPSGIYALHRAQEAGCTFST